MLERVEKKEASARERRNMQDCETMERWKVHVRGKRYPGKGMPRKKKASDRETT